MAVEKELETETDKWLKKIELERKKVSGDKDFLKNIDAYISDSRYFSGKNDKVRAFEAVIWAWAYLEIGKQQGILNNV